MTRPTFAPLARQLLRKAAWLALLGALLIAITQGFSQYNAKRGELRRSLDDIAHAYAALLSTAVWDIEPETIERLLKAIVEHREIGFVRLDVHTGQRFDEGDKTLAPNEPPLRVPIPYPNTTQGSIGTLELYPNATHLRALAQDHALKALFGHLLLLAVMFVLIYLIIRRDLQHPLERVADFARRLGPDNLTVPLDLKRSPRPTHDELDEVADGFRTLQESLRQHIGNLDAQVEERTRQLADALAEVRALSVTDPLTGCYNRRHIDERLPPEVVRAERYQRPLTVVFLDIDHFKQVNDTHGHAAGDAVLRTLGGLLRGGLRDQLDWAGRYGGEEFLIVLPETGIDAALLFAERLRQKIERTPIEHAGNTFFVSSSFGVAQLGEDEDAADLLARADALLYRAKERGRNCVCTG